MNDVNNLKSIFYITRHLEIAKLFSHQLRKRLIPNTYWGAIIEDIEQGLVG
jgi:hypothetical protein